MEDKKEMEKCKLVLMDHKMLGLESVEKSIEILREEKGNGTTNVKMVEKLQELEKQLEILLQEVYSYKEERVLELSGKLPKMEGMPIKMKITKLDNNLVLLESLKVKLEEEEKVIIQKKIIELEAFLKNLEEQKTQNIEKQKQEKNFACSNFKSAYQLALVPKFQYSLFASVHELIMIYCKEHMIDTKEGDHFFEELQKESFNNHHELLSDIPSACMRMWTSALSLRKREFCSILNEFVRNDKKEGMEILSIICKGLNTLCVIGRTDTIKIAWPPSNKLFRGSGLPDDKQYFFQEKKKYRCPMYLATSSNEDVSLSQFCRRAQLAGYPPVLFEISLNERFKCYHVNFVDKTNIPGESEFLFVPYSVFEIVKVDFKTNPTWVNPHRIHLIAAIDNAIEDDCLPLSPWH